MMKGYLYLASDGVGYFKKFGIASNPNITRYEEIITALIASGGLDGVKGGQTIIHFDPLGEFKAIQLDYYPYRKRSV
jgi:hypothetical protein